MISPTTLFQSMSPHIRHGYERYRQLRRILTTAEILRQFRFGCRLDFVNKETSERTEEAWHERTTYRDLRFLESCGFVESRELMKGNGSTWHWIDSKPLERIAPERIAVPDCLQE